MSSRDVILGAVRVARPAPEPLPALPPARVPDGDPLEVFCGLVEEIGGRIVEAAGASPDDVLAAAYPDAEVVASTAAEVPGGRRLSPDMDPHTLADLDLLVCRGVFGVAENGAIWVPESRMGHRAAPFLAQHLALLLDPGEIVWTMHEAYARLRIDAEGFGVFIAGPSKTADIEQSLVVGAHGPRSLTVVLG